MSKKSPVLNHRVQNLISNTESKIKLVLVEDFLMQKEKWSQFFKSISFEADHPLEEIVLVETEEKEVFLEVTEEMIDQVLIYQNL
jgi:hypothetical protein